jgi:hypothetical protein
MTLFCEHFERHQKAEGKKEIARDGQCVDVLEFFSPVFFLNIALDTVFPCHCGSGLYVILWVFFSIIVRTRERRQFSMAALQCLAGLPLLQVHVGSNSAMW